MFVTFSVSDVGNLRRRKSKLNTRYILHFSKKKNGHSATTLFINSINDDLPPDSLTSLFRDVNWGYIFKKG